MKRRIALALALFFALSGTAMARGHSSGGHYVITSTSQISPSVLANLKGRAGPQGVPGSGPLGPQGLQGLVGPIGLPGERGPQGKEGPTGPQGPNGGQGPAGTPGGPGVSGATGAAGATGPNGTGHGVTGPTGPTGTGGGGGSGGAREICTVVGGLTGCVLKAKAQESGTWSVDIQGSAGDPQAESDGVVSFNPQYPAETSSGLKVTYRNEPESLSPKTPCLGSVNEPTAEPGNLCVYRGSGIPKEPTDTDAKFIGFATPFGEQVANGGALSPESDQGRTGMLVQFRTNKFETPG